MSGNESNDGISKKKKKNVENFKNYQNEYFLSCNWKGLVDAKLHGAAPYFFFLTRIKDSADTYDEDLSITFPELLDKSLGTIEHSLHINFMIEFSWLLAQYAINDIFNPSMTILYDADDDDLRKISSLKRVTAVKVKAPNAFGHHHTKMSIFYYTDKSLRFAVYTANLIESDWENRTQGYVNFFDFLKRVEINIDKALLPIIWISPKCPYLGDDVPINYGESETLFKVDMLKYLNSYHLQELRVWLVRIQKADCSSIAVSFVASVPGNHINDSFGHLKLSKLLRENSTIDDTSAWELIAQCSSIGSLGPTPDSWLCGEFGRSLHGNAGRNTYPVNVIYPSVNNVSQSHDGMWGGACLPYCSQTHKRQLWLQEYLRQWKCDHRHRSRAVPHIKTYTKLNHDGNEIAWFLLTSSNLSKAAWGKLVKGSVLKILSYEAGVLFLPKFLIGKDSFKVRKGGMSNPNEEEFPLPFDSPLTSYLPTDKIFLYDKCIPD